MMRRDKPSEIVRFLVAAIAIGFGVAKAYDVSATAEEPMQSSPAAATRLGIHGAAFTLNGKPAFLLGMSYYGVLGGSDATWKADLDDMQRAGFNWIRIWANWAAFGNDVSIVDVEGRPRAALMAKLRALVAECDRRGMVVDVSFSRGNGVSGPPRLQSLATHLRAVEAVVGELKPFRNWYLDLANERNIRDKRYTSFADLTQLRDNVRKLDPERLVTASHAGDIGDDDLREYVRTVGVDFITPHRPRNAKSPGQTDARTREYLAAMQELKHVVPVHYQEPFRRGFQAPWEPDVEAFLADLKQARAGGAAGWCFHNGDQRNNPDGKPRRSFDVSAQRLFDQLDAEERKVLAQIAGRQIP